MARSKSDKLLGGLPGDHLPLYYQVAEIIRTRIVEGTWPPGSKMPTEAVLSNKYKVSRPTIRHANAILAKEGYIYSVQGSGWYVHDSGRWKSQPPVVETINDLLHFGLDLSFRIQEFGMIPNSEELRARLKNEEDDFVLQIRGVRWREDQPVSSVTYYLPFKFATRIPVENLNEEPFIPQFEKMAGIHVVEALSTMSVGQAEADVAAELHLDVGACLLEVKTVYYDIEGQAVEYIISRYRDGLPHILKTRRL